MKVKYLMMMKEVAQGDVRLHDRSLRELPVPRH